MFLPTHREACTVVRNWQETYDVAMDCLKIDPKSHHAHFLIGVALSRSKLYENSKIAFKFAYKSFPCSDGILIHFIFLNFNFITLPNLNIFV